MKQKFKQDKGVAGLTILLSVIVMLFVIGLIVMIFSLMGSRMRDATYTPTTASVQGEDVDEEFFLNATGYTLTETDRNGRSYSVVALYNGTDLLTAGNYTLVGRVLKNATVIEADELALTVNYTYVYDADNVATDVMNSTYTSIGGVTGWFSIFVVISAMVVLILLTVIIITAIRSSGMIAGADPTRDVGTA